MTDATVALRMSIVTVGTGDAGGGASGPERPDEGGPAGEAGVAQDAARRSTAVVRCMARLRLNPYLMCMDRAFLSPIPPAGQLIQITSKETPASTYGSISCHASTLAASVSSS